MGCQASTVHQHLPQLQYYHPRPGRAVHRRGYGKLSRDTSSRPSLVVTLRTARQDRGTFLDGLEVAKKDEVAGPEQETEEWEVVAGDDGTAAQEQFARELERTTAGAERSWEETGEAREAASTSDRPTVVARIQDESTSSLLQAPITPSSSSPMAPKEEPTAQDSISSAGQENEQQSAASSATPMDFVGWLPGQTPVDKAAHRLTPHVHTFEELIRPFVDPTLPPAPGMAEITQILQGFQSLTDPSYYPGVDEAEKKNLADRKDLADMLGLTDFATFGGISVDPPSSPHLPLSSDNGPVELCNDEECPIEGEHSTGMYLHKGEMPHTFNSEFGYSDPPPEIWYAWARMEELRAGEAEFAMVNGFAKCHWWNGK